MLTLTLRCQGKHAPQKHITANDNPPTVGKHFPKFSAFRLSGDYYEKARPEGRALILLHAELVDAAVGVGLTWTEEC